MKNLLNNIWYYLSYPLRLYFKERVPLYKDLLLLLNYPTNLIIFQARGSGKTHHVLERELLISKLTRFINKWDFKTK